MIPLITETTPVDLFVCFYPFLFCLCFLRLDQNGQQLFVSVCKLVIITTALPLLLLLLYTFLAVSEMLNHSDTCAVPSAWNTGVLLILLKLCPATCGTKYGKGLAAEHLD